MGGQGHLQQVAARPIMTSEANKVDPDFLDKALNMKLPRDTILATLQATSKGTSFDYEKAAASLIVIAQQLEEGQTAGLGEPQEVSRKRKLDEQGEERGEHLKPAKPRGVPHAKPAQTEQKAAKSKASPKQKSPSNGQPQSLKEMVQSGVLRPGKCSTLCCHALCAFSSPSFADLQVRRPLTCFSVPRFAAHPPARRLATRFRRATCFRAAEHQRALDHGRGLAL